MASLAEMDLPFVASLGPSREITGVARKGAYRKFCKWIYGHKQSGSNITTRGDYIITQYSAGVCPLFGWYCGSSTDVYEQGTSSTDPSKNWTWQQYGNDGAHAFAESNMYFTIDYKGYPDPIIKASGSTYSIDYGAVDMDYKNGHYLVNPDCTELPCPAGTTNQGTFYNHTAASAGTSLGKKTSDFPNEYAPDSICPKGWMLPTHFGTADKLFPTKSYENLIKTVYGEIRNGNNIGSNMDVIALYPPLSFLRAGNYKYDTTLITNPGLTGYYWDSRPNSGGVAAGLFSPSATNFMTGTNLGQGYGNSVRCVSRD